MSFLVQLLFPWELENLGNAMTLLIFGLFAVVGLLIVLRILPDWLYDRILAQAPRKPRRGV